MDTSKQMPDLMGTPTATPGATDGHRRMLAHLEHGARAQARPARAWEIDGWTVGLIVLLLTMLGIAWLMHEDGITPATFQNQRRSAATAVPAAAAAAAASTSSTAGVPAAPQAQVQAAAIIDAAHVAPIPHVAPTAPPAPQLARQPQRTVDTLRPGPDETVRDKTAGVPRFRPEMAQARPGPADTDVTLLTALVAHAGQPASVAPERTRDVVERQDGDRTGDLLRRCKQLGLMEGMLCRSRICAGRWESDAACRAPAN